MISAIFYFIFGLILKKLISDNLPSFKISSRRLRLGFKWQQRSAIRYRMKHQYKFDYADYIFDRSFKAMLHGILLLSGVLFAISFFTPFDNVLATQVFWFKMSFVFSAVIGILFLPTVPKPKRLTTTGI